MKLDAITIAALAVAGLAVTAYFKRSQASPTAGDPSQQTAPWEPGSTGAITTSWDPWNTSAPDPSQIFGAPATQHADSMRATAQNTNFLTGWGITGTGWSGGYTL